MKKYVEILIGLIALVAVVYLNLQYAVIWEATKMFLIGGIAILAALIGLLLILLGISEFKR